MPLKPLAEKAVRKGLIINTIYCGHTGHGDAASWKEFAKMCDGQYASIDQNRAAVATITTPHDKALAELSAKLSTTYIAYGREGAEKQQNQLRQDANAQTAGVAVEAARAATKATVLYCNMSWDLVDRCNRDKAFDVKKLALEELPENMRQMTPEQREAYVKEICDKRETMQKEINELNAKRVQFIAEHMKKNPSQADQAFDEALKKTLREQAARKGIEIPK